MPRSGSLGLLAVVVALTACGSADNERAGSAESLEVPPPIEAIDEAEDNWILSGDFSNEPVLGVSEPEVRLCVGKEGSGSVEKPEIDSCEPSPEEARAFQETMLEYLESVRPAPGVAPRAIARLQLDRPGGATALLIAWRSQFGKLCLAGETREPDGYGSSEPWGPCTVDHPTCPDLCLSRAERGIGQELAFVLSGVVAARADDLRVVFEDGRAARYPLVGPLVPGFPESRVFMLDLGNSLYRKVELLVSGKVIDGDTTPRRQLEMDRCLMESMHGGAEAAFERCVGRGHERFFGDRVE